MVEFHLTVLILVVMDSALRVTNCGWKTNTTKVLILVVMDSALRAKRKDNGS